MKKLLLLFVLSALLLVSCSKDGVEEKTPEKPLEEKPIVEEIVTEPEIPETPEEPTIDPNMTEISVLTGLLCTPETKALRPIAVMLNNNKASYPQESVSKADIIYECDMEGGVTRLMAIYSQWQDLGNIGSMRSARNYFVDIANSHGAIYVHAGGSPSAYEEIANTHIDNIDGVNMNSIAEIAFWRDNNRIRQCGYEHSMMTSGLKIKDAVNTLKYGTEYSSPNAYSFNSEFAINENGELAEKITLVHSNYITVEFMYDMQSKRYLKRSFGSPHLDGSNEEQLAFENVLVLFVKESVVDDEGRLDIDLTGEGKGYYLSGGKAIDINWSRDKKGDLFNLTYENTELLLNPGKTHITLFNKNYTKNVIIE